MKILIFTEGTILMHKNAFGHNRHEIIKQVKDKEQSVHEYSSYVPIGKAVDKITKWREQNNEINYLTSRRTEEEIKNIQSVLNFYNFPKGELYFRKGNEKYSDVVERVNPDVLIEDDCESIGGKEEMTFPCLNEDLKKNIKHISIKEFSGIDYLSNSVIEQ